MITPVVPTPVEAALIQWAQAQVVGEFVVILANQSAPQPSPAFATIRVASRRRLGTPDERLSSRPSGENFEAESFSEWEGTAEINFYGAAAGEAAAVVHASLDDFAVAQANATAGLYLREATPIIDATAFADVSFEARARFEVVFGFVTRGVTAAPAVDTVNFSGEVTG